MQKMTAFCRCVAIVACLLISISCRAPYRGELVGKYVRTTDSYGTETLELKADGLYVHVFSLSGQVIHNTGSWELTNDPRPGYLVFEHFQRPENPKKVTISIPAERSLGGETIKIGLEEFQ